MTFQYQAPGQLPTNMRPAPGPFDNMGSWGQMGSGTYGVPVQAPEMYSQPQLPANILGKPLTLPQIGSQSVPGMGGQSPGFLDGVGRWFKDSGFLGSTDAKGVKTDGWGGMALSAAGGLASAFMGMKQYGLAKDTLAENKKQFGLNYEAQKTTTNASLEDRQRARVASNSGAYQSVGDYMAKNGIQ